MLYGRWETPLHIGTEEYSADIVDARYAAKCGVPRILAINGLPAEFEIALVRAAQVSDVPHTWRVQECQSESEVTPEIIERGREVLRRDRKELHAHIMTYVADKNGDGKLLEFLAAGAVRDKLTRDYHDPEFPVISRAIVAPAHRGKSLGSLLVEHRMKSVIGGFFGVKPKAVHFGTESQKILHSVKRVEQEEGFSYVYIGDEHYKSSDGVHIVHDYLGFLPWYQKEILGACDVLGASELKTNFHAFMTQGVRGVTGSQLEQMLLKSKNSIQSPASNAQAALQMLEQVLFIRKKIGAEDPA